MGSNPYNSISLDRWIPSQTKEYERMNRSMLEHPKPRLLGVWALSLAALCLPAFPARAEDPPIIPLWPDGAPGAVGQEDADRPSLIVHLPPADKRNGAAIVVCPGGGYGFLAMGHEGSE